MRPQSFADVTLLVVAGGRSRRMGEDKRWLDVGGVPLLEGLLQKAAAAGFASASTATIASLLHQSRRYSCRLRQPWRLPCRVP